MKVTSVAKDWINGYKGNFSFSDVPPGQYRLVVSRPDYETIVREVDVERGKAKWVNDLVLKLAVSPLPPELGYIQIYPEGINLGEDIKITIKARDPEIISTSAHMWGPNGWSIGFSLDHKEKSGARSRIFKNWQTVGIFKIDSVYFTNKYGQTFTISVMATFEVFPPNESPFSPDFEIFGVPDYD